MIGTGEIVTAMARGRMLPMTSFTGEPPRSADRHADGGADRDGGGSPRIAGSSRLAAQAGLRVGEGRLNTADQPPIRPRVTQRLARHASERQPADRQHTPVNLVSHLSLQFVVCRSPLGMPGRPRVPSVPSDAPRHHCVLPVSGLRTGQKPPASCPWLAAWLLPTSSWPSMSPESQEPRRLSPYSPIPSITPLATPRNILPTG